ncbi:MAG: transporter substrate-binding domain-containing protein [Bdellovibrio sp.]|nr:transporter substrate-binding domain-containing protein [Bdellovibrio sp.]
MLKLVFVSFLMVVAAVPSWAVCNRIYTVGRNTDTIKKDKEGVNLISIELFNELRKHVDCVYNERSYAFDRGYNEMRHNRIDLYAFTLTNKEWDKVANPLVLYSVTRLLIVNKKVFQAKFKAEDYFQNQKINFGLVRGGVAFIEPDELKLLIAENRARFESFPDDVIELLVKGKVDAVLTSPAFLTRYMKEFPQLKTEFVVIPDPRMKYNFALYMSQKRLNPHEQKQFIDVIRDMIHEGIPRNILKKYVTPQELEAYYSF